MDLDKVFGALADATRRQILVELAERDGQSLYELCVRLIMLRKISMTRQAISKHLAILEDAGLIRVEWSGRQKLHHLNAQPLEKAAGGWLKSLSKPRKRSQ
jgi:DNA-binding transcriptional ArsR family regulator